MTGNLDREYAVWVTPDELGKKKEIHLKGKIVTFRVPEQIDGHVVLRLKGLGSRSGSQTGNLLVRINLMEEGPGTGGTPFGRTGQRSSSDGGFGSFSRMYRSRDQENGSGGKSPFTRQEAVKDPMQRRRAGLLITGAGLVLVAGGFWGILPLSAWMGGIVVVVGIYVAFFT